MPRADFRAGLFGAEGLDKALRKLAEFNGDRKPMRKAQREAFRIVHVAAKANAPRGKTGKLKKYIKLRANKRSRVYSGVHVRTGTKKEMGLPEKVLKGKNKGKPAGYYPAHVETGYGNVPPNPYLRRAFDANKDRVWRKFHVMLWRFIGEAWRERAAKVAARRVA